MDLHEILNDAINKKASDIFFISGAHLGYRIAGQIVTQDSEIFSPITVQSYVNDIFSLASFDASDQIRNSGELDFSFSVPGTGRFRANVYRQRGSLAVVLRYVMFDLPDYKQLNIPESVINLSNLSKGIVLITGAAGSGKSTTLSCMIDTINSNRSCHIITIEDPIEFLHKHKKSFISQREINIDTQNYINALRAALRQSPNVILLGEMRDYETITTAMTAAETGQLILSTLHTTGAANTIDRIIDVFPPNQQHQIRVQLSMVLQAVVSQQLLPSTDGTLIPAFEIMLVNSAVKTMIRECKTHQIDTVIQSSEGMQTMDSDIIRLVNEGKITPHTAVEFSTNPDIMARRLNISCDLITGCN